MIHNLVYFLDYFRTNLYSWLVLISSQQCTKITNVYHYVFSIFFDIYHIHKIILYVLPHVVFDNRIDFFRFSECFIPIFPKTFILIKISNIFVVYIGLTALFPTVVINNSHQEFLIEISTTKLKATTRLYLSTDPQKIDGIKLSVAVLPKFLLKIYLNIKIIKLNIFEFISSEISA